MDSGTIRWVPTKSPQFEAAEISDVPVLVKTSFQVVDCKMCGGGGEGTCDLKVCVVRNGFHEAPHHPWPSTIQRPNTERRDHN